jgi:hypothetical protein
LQEYFKKYELETTVAYQGVDIDSWEDRHEYKDKPVLGFLVSSKPRKHFEMVEKIVKRMGKNCEYVGYGASKDQDRHTKSFASRNFLYFKTDVKRPGLVSLYNLCSTWVATSTKEGLHNPVLEAALCGCAVVYPDAALAGCSDHCVDNQTAFEYQALNAESACAAIHRANPSLNEAHKKLIKEKIGDRKTAMKRLVRILESG